MVVYAPNERSISMSLSEHSHHVVHLCFKLDLCLDLLVVSSKVLSKVKLQSRPHELLCIELTGVSRQEDNLERLVISLQLLTVMC